MKTARRGSSKILFLAFIGAVIVGIVVWILVLKASDEVPPTEVPLEENTETEASWVTYENDTYGFSIEHPAEWEVTFTHDEPQVPVVNFYPPNTDTSGLPFTHHSDSVTHVSIYPHGMPTEGFFGESRTSDVSFSVPFDRATDYVLADGTPFATIVFLAPEKENWTPWGFLFAHITPEDVETTCTRGDEVLGPYECDPLMGDQISRSGELPSGVREIEVRMLESFQFTN